MQKMLVGALLAAAFPAGAQVVHLMCVSEGIQPGTTFETRIDIDVDRGVFRANGEALNLVVTDDIYGAVSRFAGRPSSKRAIDRNTGKMVVTYFDGPNGAFDREGVCEKVDPPKRKF